MTLHGKTEPGFNVLKEPCNPNSFESRQAKKAFEEPAVHLYAINAFSPGLNGQELPEEAMLSLALFSMLAHCIIGIVVAKQPG